MTKLYTILLTIVCCVVSSDVLAKRTKSTYSYQKSYTPKKTYKPKNIYEGYGKVSSTTGRIKTKSTHGYFKKSNGYKYVNPYSRS